MIKYFLISLLFLTRFSVKSENPNLPLQNEDNIIKGISLLDTLRYDTLIPIFDGLFITYDKIDSLHYISIANKYIADTITAIFTGDYITAYTKKWGGIVSIGNIIVPFICDGVKTISANEGILSVYSHSFSLNTGIPRYRYFGKYFFFTKEGISNQPGVDFNIKVEYIADWHNAEFVIPKGPDFFLPEGNRVINR